MSESRMGFTTRIFFSIRKEQSNWTELSFSHLYKWEKTSYLFPLRNVQMAFGLRKARPSLLSLLVVRPSLALELGLSITLGAVDFSIQWAYFVGSYFFRSYLLFKIWTGRDVSGGWQNISFWKIRFILKGWFARKLMLKISKNATISGGH